LAHLRFPATPLGAPTFPYFAVVVVVCVVVGGCWFGVCHLCAICR
jgi:hypothetical protein